MERREAISLLREMLEACHGTIAPYMIDVRPQQKIAEELVDVIFYILDSSRLACPDINMDEMFAWKLAKNLGRPYQYGEGHRKNRNAH